MYMATQRPTCLLLERQVVWRALSRAWAKTGKRIAARMAMIAMTTSSSIRVKPRLRLMGYLLWLRDVLSGQRENSSSLVPWLLPGRGRFAVWLAGRLDIHRRLGVAVVPGPWAL